jgi:hypothetical protein
MIFKRPQRDFPEGDLGQILSMGKDWLPFLRTHWQRHFERLITFLQYYSGANYIPEIP